MALSQTQLLFIDSYMKDGNASAACVAAGYKSKPNVKGAQLLANVSIKAEIKKRQEALAEAAQWTREEAVKTLKAVIKESPKHSDKVSASKVLNDMCGFNAPTKIEHSGLIQSISRTIIDPAKGL
jgi:phage terminase small subunit